MVKCRRRASPRGRLFLHLAAFGNGVLQHQPRMIGIEHVGGVADTPRRLIAPRPAQGAAPDRAGKGEALADHPCNIDAPGFIGGWPAIALS